MGHKPMQSPGRLWKKAGYSGELEEEGQDGVNILYAHTVWLAGWGCSCLSGCRLLGTRVLSCLLVLLFIRICTAVAIMGWDTKHILPTLRLFTMQVNVTYEFSPPQWADKSYSR